MEFYEPVNNVSRVKADAVSVPWIEGIVLMLASKKTTMAPLFTG